MSDRLLENVSTRMLEQIVYATTYSRLLENRSYHRLLQNQSYHRFLENPVFWIGSRLLQNRSHRLLENESILLLEGTPVVYSGPITITSGGTYSGNWKSTSPTTPAVTISTTSPVTITNSNIQSAGDLIASGVDGINLTVTNTSGYGLNPNTIGYTCGCFVRATNFASMVITNNYAEQVWGIYLLTGSGTVTITNNNILNIMGEYSDGSGGWKNGNTQYTGSNGSTADFQLAHAVFINQCTNLTGCTVGWNQIINQPGQSRCEDVINIYESSGTPSSPILVHDNYIQGAYNWDPTNSQGGNWGYSGSGINLGDGDQYTGSDYVHGNNNIVVSTSNGGIFIEAGSNNQMNGNTVVFSGILSTGQSIYQNPSNGNVGLIFWNEHSESGSIYGNNTGSNNTVGYMHGSSTNNVWIYNDDGTVTGTTNLSAPVTYAEETAQWTAWQNKLIANGQTVGPMI